MSKQTKIIAIVGGVLILVFLGYSLFTKGGIMSGFKAMGCGDGEKSKKLEKKQLSPKERDFQDCMAYRFVPQRTDKGNLKKDAKGNLTPKAGKGKDYCAGLWRWKCATKDAKGKLSFCKYQLAGCFAAKSPCVKTVCKDAAMKGRNECKAAAKWGEGGDEDGD